MRHSVTHTNIVVSTQPGLFSQLAFLGAAFCLLLGVVSCGGSSNSDGGSSGGDLSTDACGVLGLKIFTGTTCSGVERSPVVEIRSHFINGATALCSGTVISGNQILSAGHCFPGGASALSRIVVTAGGVEIDANDLQIHPGYFEDKKNQAIFNDIAIIQLTAQVGLTPLPISVSQGLESGEVIDIYGYGIDEAGQSGTLKSGQMLVSNVTTNHIIAVYGNEGSNTCSGDSGGPAIRLINNTPALIGVTSSGSAEAQCRQGDVSLFAYLQDPSVLQFIRTVAPGISQL